MKVYACHFHPKGFFIVCDQQDDFWVKLSPVAGWGRFSMIRPDTEFTSTGGIFQLTELRPADAEPPESVVAESNVLWRQREVLAAQNCEVMQQREY